MVFTSEIDAYEKAGWYTDPQKAYSLKSILTKGYWGFFTSWYSADADIYRFYDDGTCVSLENYCSRMHDIPDEAIEEFETILDGKYKYAAYKTYSVDEIAKTVSIDPYTYSYNADADCLYIRENIGIDEDIPRTFICHHFEERPTVWEFEKAYLEQDTAINAVEKSS